ncbi:MAG: protein phosphatase 2C domain-containing protein [Candidatus Aenigmarchaeota archaeon]|nr:protein phosphatase 2C domain-containing protein [Candidatus Aenigmarchaeota archaeon]
MKYSVAQDIGHRERQEDCYLIDEKLGLFAVADGIGGHPRGDEAAQMAVDTLHAAIGDLPGVACLESLRLVLDAADKAIVSLSRSQWPCPSCRGDTRHKMSCYAQRGPGTTLTALWFVGPEVYLMHVGDSMAYHCEAGIVTRISERHGDSWGLDQALGGHYHMDVLRPQVDLMRVCPGDLYILCTDGMVLDKEKLAELCEMVPIEDLAPQIMRESLEHRKAGDNVTVLAIEVGS